MPVEDAYDARALALSPDRDLTLDDSSSSHSSEASSPPLWSRRSTSFHTRRSSSSHARHNAASSSRRRRLLEQYSKLNRRLLDHYERLSPLQRLLACAAGIATLVLGILFLVYNERIFHALLPVAARWRDVRAGWLILWALIFVVSFPPLIGYSSLLTIAGFVYGFPNGWFIAASATVAGSTASFLVSRTLLRSLVHRLVANDKRFAALALTLKHDGLKLLVMIRLCPLPYSLSNGAVATFPTVHCASFAAATAIVTPKLMLHVFVGSQIEKIARSGGTMDAKTKALSYASIAIGGVAGVATGWLMYRKTKQRAAQLEAEERAGVRRRSVDALQGEYAYEYADDPEARAAFAAAAAAAAGADDDDAPPREDADDISLRSGWAGDYRDDEDGDADADAREIRGDPFRAGDIDVDVDVDDDVEGDVDPDRDADANVDGGADGAARPRP